MFSTGQPRMAYILPFIGESIRNSLANGLLEWYSYFGFFWLILFVTFTTFSRGQKFQIGSVLLFAALFNIVMVDKTRDFVIAILPSALLIFQTKFWSFVGTIQHVGKSLQTRLIGICAFLLILFPQIEITFEGVPRSPWHWFILKFTEFLS